MNFILVSTYEALAYRYYHIWYEHFLWNRNIINIASKLKKKNSDSLENKQTNNDGVTVNTLYYHGHGIPTTCISIFDENIKKNKHIFNGIILSFHRNHPQETKIFQFNGQLKILYDSYKNATFSL